jgi:hypothetical protein
VPGTDDRPSAREIAALAKHQQTISKWRGGFAPVGKALAEIRKLRLYRGSYLTFEDYCRTEHDLSTTYATDLIRAWQVVEILAAIADAPLAPANESQARKLAALLEAPEDLVKAWHLANDAAQAAGRKVTAAMVADAVESILSPPESTPPVEQPVPAWLAVMPSAWNTMTANMTKIRKAPEFDKSLLDDGTRKAVAALAAEVALWISLTQRCSICIAARVALPRVTGVRASGSGRGWTSSRSRVTRSSLSRRMLSISWPTRTCPASI